MFLKRVGEVGLAFTRQGLERAGGWPLTHRGDFDQQIIARLNAVGVAGDPCQWARPSYDFRWSSTVAYHGQAMMLGPKSRSSCKCRVISSLTSECSHSSVTFLLTAALFALCLPPSRMLRQHSAPLGYAAKTIQDRELGCLH